MPQSALLGIPHLARWPLGAQFDKTELGPQGPRIHQDSGPFSFPYQRKNEFDRIHSQKTSRRKVRAVAVLFSELLVPGWASDGDMIGLGEVTGAYGSDIAFTLPCHNADPELFFSEKQSEVDVAKSLCGGCPVRSQCLDAALSRLEPCGVWGGELFEDGAVIARKRTVGRPRLVSDAA